jgi:hypothetical protein
MSILPNFFSDPQLRARQDQMNSQWFALNDTVNNCQLDPTTSSLFNQFSADFYAWQQFYGSESDWTTASRNATNDWQQKLQDYTKSIGNACAFGADGSGAYIPTVKDPPPDTQSPGLLTELKNDAAAPFNWLEGLVTKIGIGLLILVIVIVGAVVLFSTKGHAEGFGVKVGS